jgi:hypothetical protein
MTRTRQVRSILHKILQLHQGAQNWLIRIRWLILLRVRGSSHLIKMLLLLLRVAGLGGVPKVDRIKSVSVGAVWLSVQAKGTRSFDDEHAVVKFRFANNADSSRFGHCFVSGCSFAPNEVALTDVWSFIADTGSCWSKWAVRLQLAQKPGELAHFNCWVATSRRLQNWCCGN